MVQFTIAYVALAVGLLLVVAGTLAVVQRSSGGALSPHQRRLLLGGLGGMTAFIVLILIWLRSSLWLR